MIGVFTFRAVACIAPHIPKGRAVKFSKKPPSNLERGADYMIFSLFKGRVGKAMG